VHAGLLRGRALGRDDDLDQRPADRLTREHSTGDLGRIRTRIGSPARADVRWRDEVTAQRGLDEGIEAVGGSGCEPALVARAIWTVSAPLFAGRALSTSRICIYM
jgi:hypothetical protein